MPWEGCDREGEQAEKRMKQERRYAAEEGYWGAGTPWWSWDDLYKTWGGKVREAHEEKLVE